MSSYKDCDPESDFYQISGYRAHSNGWFKMYDDKPMVDAIARQKIKCLRPGGPDAPVELILGILPSGASYLLMTSNQMFEFTRKHGLEVPRSRPWRAIDFLSLSPIYFRSRDDLAEKIANYKQRPRNRNRRDREEPLDNSKANRGYVKTGSDVAHYRGDFEQQRTLYRLLTKDLAPGKVGMAVPPWLSGVRVVSLVLGEWTVDTRLREERLKEPKLVHVGWTETLFPLFFEELTGSTIHLKVRENSRLSNPNSKDPHFSEVREDDLEGLYSQLRTLLSHDAQDGIPLILLVHDEEMARGVLSRAGIDIHTWPSGLSNLLALAPVRSRHSSDGHTSRHSDPTIPPRCSIVDTQKLVRAAMATTNPGRTMPQSAEVLRMQTDGTQTCAGDDSLLQLRMWLSMAEGDAIDEQLNKRMIQRPQCAHLLVPPQQERAQVAVAEADPDDDDPNNMRPAPRPTIADDFSDDDDW